MSKAEKSRATKATKRARGVLDGSKAVEARLAEGRAQRDAVPLEAHAEWTAPDDRPDPVGVLEEQNRKRVPELVPIRHRRMIVSPFTFYRGSAASLPPGCNGATSTSARLRDMKGSAAFQGMPASRLALYGEICGATLARAHARTGDAAKIAGYLGDDHTFDRALESFAVAYADQNEADYTAFSRAAEDDRIAVQRGVGSGERTLWRRTAR